jgi:thioredoxin 1
MITIKKFEKTGCRPCRILSTWLDDIDPQLRELGVVSVDHINIDHAPDVIEKYGLTSVPTLLIMRNGVEIYRFTGLIGGEELLEAVRHAKEER